MSAHRYQLQLKHLLEHGVRWAPEQEIVYRDRVRMSYRQLSDRVLRLAGALRDELGVEPGNTVGVIEWDSHRYLEMYFAIPGIGAVMHTINPRLSPGDLLYTLKHAEDDVLVFHEDFLPLVEKLRPELAHIRRFVILTDGDEPAKTPVASAEYEDLLARATPLEALPDLDENTRATLAYTTGTTGKPKGVFFTHRQLMLHAFSLGLSLAAFGGDLALTGRDIYMPLTPMFHVHAWGVPYLATLLGLKQVYPGRYEPEMLARLLKTEGVTMSHCVPTILQMLVQAAGAAGLRFPGWKVVIGGARLPKGLALAARELGIEIYAGYGLSETAPVLTLAFLKPFMDDWEEDRKVDVMISTGFPVPLVDLRIVDERGRDVEADGKATGEIVVRAPWLTEGYLREPERSEKLWEGGWMHTGDVAHMNPDGYVQIVDRLKDVIKSGGEWIVSLDLENLLSLHEGVEEAAVIGVPDPKWDERPLGIIVPRKEYRKKLTGEQLKDHLEQFVAQGKLIEWAIPDRFEFVDEIPKTSVGKIDKKVLRARYGG